MPLPKTAFFYKAIDKAINLFGEHHHITARQHFAPLLGFKGENASVQLGSALNCTTYNPATPKPLSIDHLAVLLRELGDERQVVFDALAKEYGGVFHVNAEAVANNDTISDELLQITALAGDLSSKFLEFKNNDGVIDEDEADKLEAVAIEMRKVLRVTEETLKQMHLQK